MKQATSGLALASGEVINTHDQFEVFDDARAVSIVRPCLVKSTCLTREQSDPTHSFLSKDHFVSSGLRVLPLPSLKST